MKYVIYGVFKGSSSASRLWIGDAAKWSYDEVVSIAVSIDKDPGFDGRVVSVEVQ